MTSEEDDRQRRSEFAQASLQLRTAQSRYSHVEEDAAQHTFARQALQQMLGRSIGLDLVTGVFQTTFHRCPKGRIVIDNMHEARQQTLPMPFLTSGGSTTLSV